MHPLPLILLATLLLGCQTTPDVPDDFDMSGDEFYEERQFLSAHLPADTQYLVRVDGSRASHVHRRIGEIVADPDLPCAGWVAEAVDDGAVHIAVGPLVAPGFREAVETLSPPWVDEMPRGRLVRYVISTDAPDAVHASLAAGSDDAEAIDGCDGLVNTEVRERALLVDVIDGIDAIDDIHRDLIDAIAAHDDGYTPPATPALRRHLMGGDDLSIYGELEQMRRQPIFEQAAAVPETLAESATPAPRMRLAENARRWRADLLDAPQSDVIDVTFATDRIPGERYFDVVHSYSNQGSEQYATEASVTDVPRIEFDEIIAEGAFSFEGMPRVDRDAYRRRMEIAQQGLLGGPPSIVGAVVDAGFDELVRWLDSPDVVVQHGWFTVTDRLLLRQLRGLGDVPNDQWPESEQIADLRTASVTVGADADGDADNPRAYRLGLVVEWAEPIWAGDQPDLLADLVERRTEQVFRRQGELDAQARVETTDDGAQRLLVGINTDELRVGYPDPPTDDSLRSYIQLNVDQLPHHLLNAAPGELGARLKAADSTVDYVTIDTDSHRLRRLSSDRGLKQLAHPIVPADQPPVDYDPTLGLVDASLRACLTPDEESDSLDPTLAPPEDRPELIQNFVDDTLERAQRCRNDHPESDQIIDRFEQRWLDWKKTLL